MKSLLIFLLLLGCAVLLCESQPLQKLCGRTLARMLARYCKKENDGPCKYIEDDEMTSLCSVGVNPELLSSYCC
ncbi:unnamed protein product [Caenorhabditis brenneri]